MSTRDVQVRSNPVRVRTPSCAASVLWTCMVTRPSRVLSQEVHQQRCYTTEHELAEVLQKTINLSFLCHDSSCSIVS
ncbi:hypothetical protein BVRB_7g158430 [Beta vulgaris subsp. vulgaris]|nr:hypothetical protein BVRB_7g158430 [Beta vulgaris subsp. vulgaris]